MEGGGNSGDPKDPPTGEDPGRGIKIAPPTPQAAQNSGDDGDKNKGVAGAPGPVIQQASPVASPASAIPQGNTQGVPQVNSSGLQNQSAVGNGHGLGIELATGRATPQPMATSGAHSNGNAAPVGVSLDILMTAAANPRSELQSALMQGVSPAPLVVGQGHALTLEPNSNTIAARVHEANAVRQKESQLSNEALSEGLALQARSEREVRIKDKAAQLADERSVSKEATPRMRDRNLGSEETEQETRKAISLRDIKETGKASPELDASETLVQSQRIAEKMAFIEGEKQERSTVATAAAAAAAEQREVALASAKGALSETTHKTPVMRSEGSATPQEPSIGVVGAPEAQARPNTLERTHVVEGLDLSRPNDEATKQAANAMSQVNTTSQWRASEEVSVALSSERRLIESVVVAAPQLIHGGAQKLEPLASAQAAVVSNPSALMVPTILAPQYSAQSTAPSEGVAANQSGDSAGVGQIPTKKKAKKGEGAQASRMREIIIQQLMAQHLAKVQREKLLKALIDLGISEPEYRSLVAKLGEMEVARLAQQQELRQRYAQAIPVAMEVPALKESVPGPVAQSANSDRPVVKATPIKPSQTTRAEIYKRLKDEAIIKRKSA